MNGAVAESPLTLILTASHVRKYLTADQCIAAVERAFQALGSGAAHPPVTVGLGLADGGFHIKAGALRLERTYFAVKSNGNFPDNRRRHSLPTIQGVVILADATNGAVLAIIDSVELTAKRTAAATAVAARFLARPDARQAAIVGCGFQAFHQIEALSHVRALERVIAVDIDMGVARTFAAMVSENLGIPCAAENLSDAAAEEPDIWVTCSTSTEFLLFPEHVGSGAFVAGVGVDNEHKRELAPGLLAKSHVIADLAEQCAEIGDLHHALAAGVRPLSVQQLGDIAVGRHPGRINEEDICIFDSTGIGLQDVAACAAAYEGALAARDSGDSIAAVALAR